MTWNLVLPLRDGHGWHTIPKRKHRGIAEERVQVSRADSFDFERLEPVRHLTRSFSLEAQLSQPNPHTHLLKRERTIGEVETCIACFPLMITNEHPWPLFIGKGLYKNSLELEASRISRSSHIFIHKLLARRPITLVLMMINSCSYSTNDLVFN